MPSPIRFFSDLFSGIPKGKDTRIIEVQRIRAVLLYGAESGTDPRQYRERLKSEPVASGLAFLGGLCYNLKITGPMSRETADTAETGELRWSIQSA